MLGTVAQPSCTFPPWSITPQFFTASVQVPFCLGVGISPSVSHWGWQMLIQFLLLAGNAQQPPVLACCRLKWGFCFRGWSPHLEKSYYKAVFSVYADPSERPSLLISIGLISLGIPGGFCISV